MPSACDATEGHMGTFSWCWGSIYSFLYAMWSECLTDNLTEEDEELRLHGLCWCSSPPMWFLHPPPSRPCRCSHTPWQKITAFSNSRAGLPPGFLWFWLFYVRLLLPCQSWLISLFVSGAFHQQRFVFAKFYHLICLYISSVAALPFLSLSLHHFNFSSLHWVTVTVLRQFIFTPLPLLQDSEETADLCKLTVQACQGQRVQHLWFSAQKAPYHMLLFSIFLHVLLNQRS